MKYNIVDKSHSEDIAALAVCLMNEILEKTGNKHFEVDVRLAFSLCENYISNGLYHIMAAFDEDRVIGFGAICESRSLYAKGAFGIIQELYIMPRYRSKGVGKSLIDEIIKYSKSRGWKRLELCTPPVPEFDRTVEFYQSNGFEITGGYKMKYVIA